MQSKSTAEWADSVKAGWVAIGSILTVVGVKLPAFLPEDLFTATFASLVVTAAGAIITLVQFFRRPADPGTLGSLTVSREQFTRFKYNPFKLRLVSA